MNTFRELEDFGVMTEEMTESANNYDYRGAIAYCEQKGKSTSEMTDEEVKMFSRKNNKALSFITSNNQINQAF